MFKETHKNIPIYSDEKVSLKRKALIGLLILAIIGGATNGYMQRGEATKINTNQKEISPTLIQQTRE